MLFTTRRKDPVHPYVKDNPVCFIATNIPSYMGGRKNLWKQSEKALALANPYNKPVYTKQPLFLEQRFDDSKLEIVAFKSILGLGIGKCYRVAQDEGPIEWRFKEGKKDNTDYYSYLNIDGEYYKMKNPEKINI